MVGGVGNMFGGFMQFFFGLLFGLIFFFPLTATCQVFSNIHFENNVLEIKYASLEQEDPLGSCPVESFPDGIQKAIDLLVSTVSNSVSKLKKTQGENCADLDIRLNASRSQIGDALKNQFVAVSNVNSQSQLNQNQINFQVQQANALNELLMTTSEVLQRQCVNSRDDFIAIQKLTGQIITLGGLITGGWQGIAIAAGGQVLGQFPFFRSDIDKALMTFQSYDEKTETGSMFCLFRQMQKMSCMMFANESDTSIGGIDLSFKSGPTETTLESIADYQQKNPALFSDLEMLQNIYSQADQFLSTQIDSSHLWGAYSTFKGWCQSAAIRKFVSPEFKDRPISTHLNLLNDICDEVNDYKVQYNQDKDLESILKKSYFSISELKSEFQLILKKQNSIISDIARTIESREYFNRFKKTVEFYQNSVSGNQARLNYHKLVNGVGSTIVKDLFIRTLESNHTYLIEDTFDLSLEDRFYSMAGKTLKKALNHHPFRGEPAHAIKLRQRAISAMIDLCQTFDPSLVCLYPDRPQTNSFQKTWKKGCAGPSSLLCKTLLTNDEVSLLIGDIQQRRYFESLCGIKEFEMSVFSEVSSELGAR
jgi:hypothetical protein